jgi:hypothetical protein
MKSISVREVLQAVLAVFPMRAQMWWAPSLLDGTVACSLPYGLACVGQVTLPPESSPPK